jgi:hypothetical protein
MASATIELTKDGLATTAGEPFDRFPEGGEVVHRAALLGFVVAKRVGRGE